MLSTSIFESLNLSHKGTRNRVTFLLAKIQEQDVFDRTELDELCGQRNKPLGTLLRKCFHRVPSVVALKSGERILYRPYEPWVQELKKSLDDFNKTSKEI